jgi:recombination associated protein RdgC
MFRNVRYYRLKGDWPDSEEAVSAALNKDAFIPCGPLTERSSGWVPIDANLNELLARRLNGAELIRLRSQSRVLPPAVINEVLEERIDDFRERMQEEPGRREKRRLKAETRDTLLPKALLKSDRIWGYVDLAENIIGVDAAQAAACERFLRHLRIAFETLSTVPLKYNQPVDALLTRIFLGDAPDRFTLGRECRMQDATDAGSTVRWTDFDLTDKTIRDHVADGMRLTHLAIEYDNVLSFVLDENGVLSKLRLLGVDGKENKDAREDIEEVARLDAEFVLLTGMLRQLVGDLKKLLGGFE